MQINYNLFSDKREDKKFTYFAYNRSKKYGFLTNYPLIMQCKTLYFLELDEKSLLTVKKITLFYLFVTPS